MSPDFAKVQADLRLEFAPEPGARGAVERVCEDCAAAYWDWVRKDRRICAPCGADRQREQWAYSAAGARRRGV